MSLFTKISYIMLFSRIRVFCRCLLCQLILCSDVGDRNIWYRWWICVWSVIESLDIGCRPNWHSINLIFQSSKWQDLPNKRGQNRGKVQPNVVDFFSSPFLLEKKCKLKVILTLKLHGINRDVTKWNNLFWLIKYLTKRLFLLRK